MALDYDYIVLSTSSASNANFQIAPTGLAGPISYMKVFNPSEFTIRPTEKVSVLVIPNDDPITLLEASGYLADTNQTSDTTRGMYIWRYTNDTSAPQSMVDFRLFPLGRTFENVKYNLYWLQEHAGEVIFDSETAGVYSFPHNLQPQELRIGAEIIDDNTRMRYTLRFPEVNNSGAADYGAGNQPYLLNISYAYGTGTVSGYFGGTTYTFSDTVTYSGFDAGAPTDGIVFDLPYYDLRPGWYQVPAQYTFRVNYNCADPAITGSIPLSLPINHQLITDSGVLDLDSWVTTHLDDTRLRRIDEVYIERGVLDRTRLSIGIKDIAVPQKTYKRKGTYVSNPYTSEYPIYTFSLRVDEFIPDYAGIQKYDIVKYFVEFNSRPWVRISPLNRDLELDGSTTVPKLLVFDSDPGQGSESVSFLDYQAPVTIFRIKIAFDATAVTDTLFIPPEIRDYKCVIFDKNQLLEI